MAADEEVEAGAYALYCFWKEYDDQEWSFASAAIHAAYVAASRRVLEDASQVRLRQQEGGEAGG